jgi:hypothetical protein
MEPSTGVKMKFMAVGLLLLASSGVGLARIGQAKTERGSSGIEKTLIDAEQRFIDATKKGDIPFFKQTLTSDFSYVSYDGQLYGRQDMVDQYVQPGTDIQPYEIRVVSAGDGVAIVTYNVVFRVPPSEDQGPPPRYQHFTTVWVKQGDAWKMKFQQMTAAHWGDW